MTPDWCIIYNPTAGRGRARQRIRRLLRVLKYKAEFRRTRGPGHAAELAEQAARDGFPTVGAAGGDGTVHEVACGLLAAGRTETALAVFPVGSANDYAHSLGLAEDWWRRGILATCIRRVDVGLAERADGRRRHFINGIGIGFNCMVTIEAIRLPRLQGVALYGVAMLRALWNHYASPVMAVRFDEQRTKGPTLALTLAIGRREGNFVLAPDARLDDGLFDYLHVGPLPRRRLLRYVPRMISGRLPTFDPLVRTGRCREAEVASEAAITAHTDGELFCLPADNVRTLTVRSLPGALAVRVPAS